MDKYTIAPPSGSTNNSVGAEDRPWHEGYFDSVKLNGGDVGEYLAESTGYGIVSGCEPSISGLTVTVGAGVVHLADGTRKEIAETSVTLDAADSTNPRIDLVYIDSAGVVAKITGTASASPVVPSVPANGISVAQVSVAAGATTGTITDSRGMLSRYYNTGIVNVKDFGAVGDGTHDDTVAIQSAIDANPDKIIYLPQGQYLVTSKLNISGSMRGDGWDRALNNANGSTIIAGAGITTAVVDVSNAVTNFFIENLKIKCPNDDTVDGIYGDLTKTSRPHINNVSVTNVRKIGINLSDSTGTSRFIYLDNITILGAVDNTYVNSIGINLGSGTFDSKANNLEIMGCQIGIRTIGVIYGENWHIWCGDMFGQTDSSWWEKTVAIHFPEAGTPAMLNNMYLDTAYIAIKATSTALVTINNLLVMNDENINSAKTDSKLFDGEICGTVSNAQIWISAHMIAPFKNMRGLRTSNWQVKLLTSLDNALANPTNAGGSLYYPVVYTQYNITKNGAHAWLLAKVQAVNATVTFKVMRLDDYLADVSISFANGAYQASSVTAKRNASNIKLYLGSADSNGVRNIYAVSQPLDGAYVYTTITAEHTPMNGGQVLDLGVVKSDGHINNDFTTSVTDFSNMQLLGS